MEVCFKRYPIRRSQEIILQPKFHWDLSSERDLKIFPSLAHKDFTQSKQVLYRDLPVPNCRTLCRIFGVYRPVTPRILQLLYFCTSCRFWRMQKRRNQYVEKTIPMRYFRKSDGIWQQDSTIVALSVECFGQNILQLGLFPVQIERTK